MKRIYQGKYRVDSWRLKRWDYGAAGFYFVTICTADMKPYFGETVAEEDAACLNATEIGDIAIQCWEEIPKHYPFVHLDEFIVMPNHVHGLLMLDNQEHSLGNWQQNAFGPQSKNLGAIIRGYKVGVKKYATMHEIPFAWQSRYHDVVVQSELRLEYIRQYIRNNPAKWLKGKQEIHPDHIPS